MKYSDASPAEKNARHVAAINHLMDHSSPRHFEDFDAWGDMTDEEIDNACKEPK